MTTPFDLLIQASTRPVETHGARLTTSLALYGGALGAGALLVALLAQTAQERYPAEPEHLALVPSLILSSGGFLVGALIAGLVTYTVAYNRREPLNLLIWIAVGFGFGVLLPVFTGVVLPFAMVFVELDQGTIELSDVFIELSNAIFRAPGATFSHAVFGLFSSLLAGFVFGIGAWLVDTANAASRLWMSRYGSYGIAVVLSILAIGFAAFGPPSFIARLG